MRRSCVLLTKVAPLLWLVVLAVHADDSLDAAPDGAQDEGLTIKKPGSEDLEGELLTRERIAQWQRGLKVCLCLCLLCAVF